MCVFVFLKKKKYIYIYIESLRDVTHGFKNMYSQGIDKGIDGWFYSPNGVEPIVKPIIS